ncbi:MAG: extracytoplasmic sigma factor ECF [Planctomycetota bacterium]|nr:MAG: extracytoplasmic sigma factor ECF [Planctomycetota bacterium]
MSDESAPTPPGDSATAPESPADVSVLLRQLGNDNAEERRAELFQVVYAQLHDLARQKMRKEAAGHTLQATVLVHEAWMRLGGNDDVAWSNRAHFFGAAGEAMRRILVDHARKKASAKRGRDFKRLPLDGLELFEADNSDLVLAVDDALAQLETFDERLAEVVRLRFWAGLDEQETAELLDLSPRTVRRDWKLARAWLARELEV